MVPGHFQIVPEFRPLSPPGVGRGRSLETRTCLWTQVVLDTRLLHCFLFEFCKEKETTIASSIVCNIIRNSSSLNDLDASSNMFLLCHENVKFMCSFIKWKAPSRFYLRGSQWNHSTGLILVLLDTSNSPWQVTFSFMNEVVLAISRRLWVTLLEHNPATS